MNTLQTRRATGLTMAAFASLWALALAVVPAASAQENLQTGDHPKRHLAMQAREFHNLEQGRGMGMASAAETNGYPGPKHVLEHATALELTDAQLDRSRELMARVKTRAPELGRQVVDAEKRLEAMFADGSVTEAKMDSLLMEIGKLRARLRSVHLTAHLDQAAVLTEAQIEQYMTLRSADRSNGKRQPMRRMLEMKRESTSRGDN